MRYTVEMDENTYSTKDIAAFFNVSHQAVKAWAREFSDYLTPSARPEEGKRRVFQNEDVRVFALVRDYTKNGYNFSDAHLALKAGQRGEMPDTPADIVAMPPPQLLANLRQEISQLTHRLSVEKERGDQATGQVQLLERLLADKEKHTRELYEVIGRLRARLDSDED